MNEGAALLLLLLIGYAFKGGAPASGKKRGAPAGKGTRREANRTPQTPDAARAQIVASFTELQGKAPTAPELALLLAHSAGETARWAKMYGWNYGFTTTLGGRDYFQLPGNPLLFKWFADAPTGCRDWLEMLRDSFPGAWSALPSGDPAAYVQGLVHGRAGSYFGDAPVAAYELLVTRLAREFLPLAEGRKAPQGRRQGAKAEWLLPLRRGKR
jgi:hypothetical protein